MISVSGDDLNLIGAVDQGDDLSSIYFIASIAVLLIGFKWLCIKYAQIIF